MRRRVRLLSALAAGTLACVVGTSTAHAALLSSEQYKCQAAIGKEGEKFVKGAFKLLQTCINANLVTPASCPPPDLTTLRTKLRSGIANKCTFLVNTPSNLATIGFPGACLDPDPPNGFTLTNLQDCIENSHEDIVADLLAIEYDATVTTGTLTGTALKCQQEIAKNSAKFVATVMKSVQKCRNSLLNCKIDSSSAVTCKLDGILPQNCATGEPKAAAAITKASDKAQAAIASKCSDADATALKACEPNQITITGAAAATCERDSHRALTDNPDPTAGFDLLDYEYAQPGICGDNRKNQPSEECDGPDAVACPGQCGSAAGLFPCLCQNIKRTRVVEHANSDLDNGWSGDSHDSGIVEGGGYVTDLWDCDGPAGPDTTCNVGPSCSGGAHSPCSPMGFPKFSDPAPANADTGDEICATLGEGTCRKTAGGATGPHCEIDFQKRCVSNVQCTAFSGDRCIFTPHGPPLPISSGGVSVCVVNIFSEDVVGTTDLDPTPGPGHGEGAVRLRQASTTFLGPDKQQPCPVCGGFCTGVAGPISPGARNLCASDADCSGGATCVLDSVCSWGPKQDVACRPNPPAGGPTEFFGNPSVDCPMNGVFLGTIDILFGPATTGTTTKTAGVPCQTPGWTNKVCVGGANQHAPCTSGAECASGVCNDQCFCPGGVGGGNQKPNACQSACLYGADDAQPCADDSECTPPGFCHPGDCRLDGSDTDSTQEGLCTIGPADGRCSVHTFNPCTVNSGCSNLSVCIGGLNDNTPCSNVSECPGATGCGTPCPFCDAGETCAFKKRQCFLNPTISRGGVPGAPDRETGALFCITATGSAAVNAVAGLPGPGAITNPSTTYEVGF